MLKAAEPDGVEWLTAICRTAWEQGNIPEDWRKDWRLSHFTNGKAADMTCHNYRGITLSVPGKVFTHVLLASEVSLT